MPIDHYAGHVVVHVPLTEETFGPLNDWCRARGRTVDELLKSLARDAAHAAAKHVGITLPPEPEPAPVVAVEPKSAWKPTIVDDVPAASAPDHLALLDVLDGLGIEHPVLPRGWTRRRVSDFDPTIGALFALGWDDGRIGALLGYTPSAILEARRRLGSFRNRYTFSEETLRIAQEEWQADPRRAAFDRLGVPFPPLREGTPRLVCRDFRDAIGVLALDHDMTDTQIGRMLGYGESAVSVERRALGIPAKHLRKRAS